MLRLQNKKKIIKNEKGLQIIQAASLYKSDNGKLIGKRGKIR